MAFLPWRPSASRDTSSVLYSVNDVSHKVDKTFKNKHLGHVYSVAKHWRDFTDVGDFRHALKEGDFVTLVVERTPDPNGKGPNCVFCTFPGTEEYHNFVYKTTNKYPPKLCHKQETFWSKEQHKFVKHPKHAQDAISFALEQAYPGLTAHHDTWLPNGRYCQFRNYPRIVPGDLDCFLGMEITGQVFVTNQCFFALRQVRLASPTAFWLHTRLPKVTEKDMWYVPKTVAEQEKACKQHDLDWKEYDLGGNAALYDITHKKLPAHKKPTITSKQIDVSFGSWEYYYKHGSAVTGEYTQANPQQRERFYKGFTGARAMSGAEDDASVAIESIKCQTRKNYFDMSDDEKRHDKYQYDEYRKASRGRENRRQLFSDISDLVDKVEPFELDLTKDDPWPTEKQRRAGIELVKVKWIGPCRAFPDGVVTLCHVHDEFLKNRYTQRQLDALLRENYIRIHNISDHDTPSMEACFQYFTEGSFHKLPKWHTDSYPEREAPQDLLNQYAHTIQRYVIDRYESTSPERRSTKEVEEEQVSKTNYTVVDMRAEGPLWERKYLVTDKAEQPQSEDKLPEHVIKDNEEKARVIEEERTKRNRDKFDAGKEERKRVLKDTDARAERRERKMGIESITLTPKAKSAGNTPRDTSPVTQNRDTSVRLSEELKVTLPIKNTKLKNAEQDGVTQEEINKGNTAVVPLPKVRDGANAEDITLKDLIEYGLRSRMPCYPVFAYPQIKVTHKGEVVENVGDKLNSNIGELNFCRGDLLIELPVRSVFESAVETVEEEMIPADDKGIESDRLIASRAFITSMCQTSKVQELRKPPVDHKDVIMLAQEAKILELQPVGVTVKEEFDTKSDASWDDLSGKIPEHFSLTFEDQAVVIEQACEITDDRVTIEARNTMLEESLVAATEAMLSQQQIKAHTEGLERRIKENHDKVTRFDDVSTEQILDQDTDGIDLFIDAQRIAKRKVDKERCDDLNDLAEKEADNKDLLATAHAKAIANLRIEHELQLKSVADDFKNRRDIVHQQADKQLELLIVSTENYLETASNMLSGLKREASFTQTAIRRHETDVDDKLPESAAKRARVEPDE